MLGDCLSHTRQFCRRERWSQMRNFPSDWLKRQEISYAFPQKLIRLEECPTEGPHGTKQDRKMAHKYFSVVSFSARIDCSSTWKFLLELSPHHWLAPVLRQGMAASHVPITLLLSLDIQSVFFHIQPLSVSCLFPVSSCSFSCLASHHQPSPSRWTQFYYNPHL